MGRKHTITLMDMHIAVSITKDRNNEIICTEMHERNLMENSDNFFDVHVKLNRCIIMPNMHNMLVEFTHIDGEAI